MFYYYLLESTTTTTSYNNRRTSYDCYAATSRPLGHKVVHLDVELDVVLCDIRVDVLEGHVADAPLQRGSRFDCLSGGEH